MSPMSGHQSRVPYLPGRRDVFPFERIVRFVSFYLVRQDL